MESSRVATGIHKVKSRLVLNKKFKGVETLDLGDTGQARISGVIEEEYLKELSDNTEVPIKLIYVSEFEIITNKSQRI